MLREVKIKVETLFLILFYRFKEVLFESTSIHYGKNDVDVNPKIPIILPIVLALLLPGLSFYTFEGMTFSHKPRFYILWVSSSFFLYNLWYLLWNLWELKREYRKVKYILKLILYTMGSLGLVTWGTLIGFQEFDFSNLARASLGVSLFLAIQYALKGQKNITQLQIEKEQIQTESYKAQLKVLHAKIDPHFLFNSLNTLRSMVRKSHSNSEKFILSLSDFYRQTLSYNENIKLRLSEELTVLESYLFLMKSRNEAAVFVNIDIDESLHSFLLPTLALQVVVENCFKHNSMSKKRPLRIDISNTDDGYIEVKNNIQPKIGAVASTGYGLDVLKKRYELMAIPEGIQIKKSSGQFRVKLKLIP